jgi:hypothetical protein
MSQKNKRTLQVGVAAAQYFSLEFAMPNKQSHVAKIQGHIEGGISGFPIQQAQRTMSQKNKPTTKMGVAAANYFLLEFPASLCPHKASLLTAMWLQIAEKVSSTMGGGSRAP